MRSMPLLLPTLALAGGQVLSTDYGRTRTLRVSSELAVELSTSFEMKVDSEPVERPGGAGGGASKLERRSVLVDQVLEGEGARPRKVRRSFETLSESSERTFGEETRADERSGPLEGLVVELTIDEQGEVGFELVTGARPDDETLLEGHELALALDALLPEGEVEEGASWTLDGDTVQRALGSVLDLRLFPEPVPEEGGGGERGQGRRGFGRRGGGAALFLPRIRWEGKATLVELVEHEGESCAKIELELEGQGDMPEPQGRGFGGPRVFEPGALTAPVSLEGTIRAGLEGTLLFSLARQAPVELALEGELATDNTFEGEREGRTFSSHSTQEGELDITVTIEED